MTYMVKKLDGALVSEMVYASRKEAKVERDRLIKAGTVCVVSRGPDHPNGPTRPDPRCLNIEKTSFKRKRQKLSDLAA